MPDPRSNPPTPEPKDDKPAAGPHARSDLTNKDATPGTGSLPDDDKDNEADVGAE